MSEFKFGNPIDSKVIKIKPLHEIRQQTNKTEDDDQNHQEQKVNVAEEELQHLNEIKEQLSHELNDMRVEKENWEITKKQLIEQAKNEGYETGLQLGKEESIEQYSQLLKKANEIVQSATKDYESIIDKHEETIVHLAIRVAEKIIKKKIKEQPLTFIPIVKSAIKELKDQTEIAIYLHADQYQHVLNQKEELLQSLDGDVQLSIYIDQDLAEDDCMIKHPLGQIEASVDTQLQQIKNVLLEVVTENE